MTTSIPSFPVGDGVSIPQIGLGTWPLDDAEVDVDLGAGKMEQLVGEFRSIYESETGEPFPQDPQVQLSRSIEAVFQSWNTPRARTYRREYHIADDLGTAVNVVQMVFGNM